MSLPLLAARRRLARADPAPPCPSCSAALSAIDPGRLRLWLCTGCDTTLRRA